MNRVIHTPEGMRDIYGEELLERQELIGRLSASIMSFGYREIETPSLEYFDVFSKDIGTTPSKDLYKCFDHEGNTLVLRPDFTPSVCRFAASHFADREGALRITYRGNVFVNSSSYRGRLNESGEVGAELLFDPSVDADAEIIAAAAESLRSTGLSGFKIGIGHADILKGLIEYAGLSEEEAEVRDFITNHNFFGLDQFLSERTVAGDLKRLFSCLQKSYDDISEAEESFGDLSAYPLLAAAFDRLHVLSDLLQAYGVDSFISFDPGLISTYRYYTGIIFKCYAYGTGEPVISGGRYDRLLDAFGTKGAAIGFAVFCDEVYSAVKSAGITISAEGEDKVLTYTDESRADVIRKAVKIRALGGTVTLVRSMEDC